MAIPVKRSTRIEVIQTQEMKSTKTRMASTEFHHVTADIFLKNIQNPTRVTYWINKVSSFFSESCQITCISPVQSFKTQWQYGSSGEHYCQEELCHLIERTFGETFSCNDPYTSGCCLGIYRG
jgi:hypothetical protein